METTDRIHALDAVRAFALLLGIVLHATLSFMPGLGQLGWPIVDNSPSVALGAVFFVIHVFRMTLFFVIAGYFARLVFHRHGALRFWKDRSKRILVPLFLAWPVVMPLLGAAMYWAAVLVGKPYEAPKPSPGTIAPFPLAHLWFLYVLWWFYVLFLATRALIKAMPRVNTQVSCWANASITWVTSVPFGAAILALPIALVLYWRHGWMTWSGIPTPDSSLLINLPAFVGFGTAFISGWLLQRQPRALLAVERYCGVYAMAAIALTILAMWVGGFTPSSATDPLIGISRGVYIIAYSAASWFWTFAIIGGTLRHLSHASPLRRYFADASYWLYLMHLPIVFALQAMVTQWKLHWVAKFPLILCLTMLVLLLSYHYLVRSTSIGKLLNGRRYPRVPMIDAWRGIDAATIKASR